MMDKTDKNAIALLNRYPNAKFSIGNTYSSLNWKDKEISKPTEEEFNNAIKAYDAKQYQRDRLQEYPSIQECIHAILDDDLTALQAKRKLIKDKYPKPE
jgi:hypothetical protein